VQIIVNPAEQRAFAIALSELVDDMRIRQDALGQQLAHLGKSWQDGQAKRFGEAQEEMGLYLLAFYNQSRRYAEYLGHKARAAEDYLKVR
jgi:hypothetical protein